MLRCDDLTEKHSRRIRPLVRWIQPAEANSFSVAIYYGAQAVHAGAIGRPDETFSHEGLEALPGDVQGLRAFIGGDQPISKWLLSVQDSHKERFSQFMGGGAVNLSNAFLQASCCSGESCLNW